MDAIEIEANVLPRLTRTAWTEPWRMPAHEHSDARLVVTLSGSFRECYDGKTHQCSPGTLISRPPAQRHSEEFTTAAGSYVSVALPNEWLASHVASLGTLNLASPIRNARIYDMGRSLLMETRHGDNWALLSLQGLTLQLLAELGRFRLKDQAKMPERIDRVCEAIRSQPPDRSSLESLAALAGLHPAHLSRAFRTHMGMTLGSYARLQRVEFARHLLQTTAKPLAEISAEAGFFDQSHLSRTFKRAYGVTPSAYRASKR